MLAKLSVALGRLRFTRSCLASPRPASPHLASPAVCVFARNVDTSTCPRRRSPRPGSASVLTERPRENWKEGNARREHRARRSVRERERGNDRDVGMRAAREGERDIARKAPTSETPRRAVPAGGFEPVAAVAAVNRAGALNPRRPRRSQSRCTRLPPRVSLFEGAR